MKVNEIEFLVEALKGSCDRITLVGMDFYVMPAGVLDAVVEKLKAAPNPSNDKENE